MAKRENYIPRSSLGMGKSMDKEDYGKMKTAMGAKTDEQLASIHDKMQNGHYQYKGTMN